MKISAHPIIFVLLCLAAALGCAVVAHTVQKTPTLAEARGDLTWCVEKYPDTVWVHCTVYIVAHHQSCMAMIGNDTACTAAAADLILAAQRQ